MQPVLDEQRLEELQDVLSEAIHDNLTVRITYYEKKRLNSVVGVITKVSNEGLIYIDAGDRPVKLSLQAVTDMVVH